MSGSRATDRALLAAVALVLALTVLYPTLRLFAEAAAGWDWPALTGPMGRAAVWNTLWISLASVLCAGLLGTALAFALTQYAFPGRGVLAAVAYLPFTLPPLVGTLSFWYLVGRDGLVPRAADAWFGLGHAYLEGPLAVLLIHTYSFYVFFYAMVSSALEGIDRSVIEAARTLGASRFRVLTRVTLPILRPALVGASLLTFMSSGASFSAPYYFGGGWMVLSTEIYVQHQSGPGARSAALTLTVALALVAFLGVALFRSNRRSAGQASKGVRTPLRSAAGKTAAAVAAWAAVLLLLAPHAAILALSFADHRAWRTELIPTTWTAANYALVFSDRNMLQPILNSLWMSAAATAAIVLAALPAAYLIGRGRPGGRWINLLVMIPWALPGTVTAINLIVAFNDPWLALYGTVWLLPLAYFVRGLPLFTRMAAAAVETFDAGLVEAGRTLGASPAYCFRRIVAPLLMPAIAAGAALAFATSLGEYVASILLYLPANLPIAVKIDHQWRGSGIGAAFAYSVFLMVLVGATFAAARRLASRAV